MWYIIYLNLAALGSYLEERSSLASCSGHQRIFNWRFIAQILPPFYLGELTIEKIMEKLPLTRLRLIFNDVAGAA